MENKELKFKTNLNCGGCLSKIQSDMDHANGVISWNVDIHSEDKILTVLTVGIDKEEIIEIVKSKGFEAEPIVV